LYIVQLMSLPLTVSCFIKIQIGFTLLVPAHLGSRGQTAVNWVLLCGEAKQNSEIIEAAKLGLKTKLGAQFLHRPSHLILTTSYHRC